MVDASWLEQFAARLSRAPVVLLLAGNITSCFFKDPVGVALLDQVGIDNVVFETDYPHSDSTWPHSREAAMDQFGHLDAVAINKIARDNATTLLGLQLPAV